MITFQQFKDKASKLEKTTAVLPDEFNTLIFEDFQSDYTSLNRGFRLYQLKHGAVSIPWFYNSSLLKYFTIDRSSYHKTWINIYYLDRTKSILRHLETLLEGNCNDRYKQLYTNLFSKEIYEQDKFTVPSQADAHFFLSDSSECDVYVVYSDKSNFCIIPAVIDDGMLCSSLSEISNSKDLLQNIYKSLSRKIQFFELLRATLAEQSKLKQLLNG